ncbi:sugar porter family MFS transporter, partial [Streptomyces sp. SID11233]|nr:sugar porter family MFS transporter [Streptomyces sp. SID11233]
TILAVELVDRWGRRPLMLLSAGLMFVALVPLGVSFLWDVPAHSLVALLCLLAYVAAFAIGLGPVVWLLLAEIFPPEQRALGTAVCTTVNWLANFVVNQFFLTLVGALGQGETFWLFAAVCL